MQSTLVGLLGVVSLFLPVAQNSMLNKHIALGSWIYVDMYDWFLGSDTVRNSRWKSIVRYTTYVKIAVTNNFLHDFWLADGTPDYTWY